MALPPTRKEQLALDELLNDIYRGIESLPDSSQASAAQAINEAINANNNTNGNKYKVIHYKQEPVKQYELDSSSPLVQQHKAEIASYRKSQQHSQPTPTYPFATSNSSAQISNSPQSTCANPASSSQQQQQPGKSTLKRQQQQQQQEAQSLASFLKADLSKNQQADSANLTGTSKRRVRIVDHPEKLAKQNQVENKIHHSPSYPIAGSPYARSDGESRVKYVNSNQLIYHEEPPSKWNEHDSVYTPVIDKDVLDQHKINQEAADNSDDSDIDGTTRVEYYHTSWLDRQLGRASKRRSSKELNERQVKEKAMIDELKRSLKNGAITLKRSLKGGNKHNNNKHNNNNYHGQYLTSADDQLNSYTDRPAHKAAQKSSSIFATIPRKQPAYKQKPQPTTAPYVEPESEIDFDASNKDFNNNNFTSSLTTNKYQQTHESQVSPTCEYSSRSLSNQANNRHQLIKSHYRPGNNFNTLSTSNQSQSPNQQGLYSQPSLTNDNNMKYPQSSTLGHKPALNNCNINNSQQQYNTISRIPSATEVVRTALESSRSRQEDQRLRKTINSIDTPSPYPSSPQTPTHQLKAASPSLSPSPVSSPGLCTPINNYNSQELLRNQNMSNNMSPNGQQVLRGTRIIPAPSPSLTENKNFNSTTNNSRQPVYANPHASLMQQRAEQRARGVYATGIGGQASYRPNNQASLREFNELDSLLKSLSPNSTSAQSTRPMTTATNVNPSLASKPASCGPNTQITPGYLSGPNQAILGGYGGFFPTNNQHQPQHQQSADVYAKIQRQNNTKPLQPSHLNNSNFTLDVTDDRSTLERPSQKQHQSSNSQMKVPNQYEILPSMEDYQNISKLNPVKNHYWYKPNMTRDRAIALLRDKPQGTFIVRDSNSFRGAYGLAVKVSKLPPNVLNNSSLRDPRANPSDELIRHFLIEPSANGVRLKGYANEPVFGSLPNLIYQHSLTELALPCRLIIPRADIEDPQFNLKQKQFLEEFLASKDEAKHIPYERTSPNGGYRRYPGDVLIHNEHRIIFQ